MLHRTLRLVTGAITAAALAAALPAQAAGAAYAAKSPISSAYGISANLGPISLAKQARSAFPAGPPSASVASVKVGDTGSATGVSSASSGNKTTGAATSTGKLGSISLNLNKLATLTTGAVSATCAAQPGKPPTGKVSVAGASFKAGSATADLGASTAPNTAVTLPNGLGKAVVNEQIKDGNTLTVNALHITLGGDLGGVLDGDLILGSATCQAGTPAPTGAINATVKDIKTKKPVPATVTTVQSSKRLLPTDCATGPGGQCAFKPLPLGTYIVCITDVPEGYVMPTGAARCSAVQTLDEQHLVRDVVLYLAKGEKTKKGK